MRKIAHENFLEKKIQIFIRQMPLRVTNCESCGWMRLFTSPHRLQAVQSLMPLPFLARVDLAMPCPF